MSQTHHAAFEPKFYSTKTFGHDLGLSCCFRQWRATHSHCSLLHGYAIAVSLEFRGIGLDDKNWVVDFGDLGEIKDYLKATFDHTLLVAEDDPELDTLTGLAGLGLANVITLPAVGCEAFAAMVGQRVQQWVHDKYGTAVFLEKVEVREHGANSAYVKYKHPLSY